MNEEKSLMILEKHIQQAAAAAVKAVDDHGNYVQWAQENELYLPHETLQTWIQSNHEGVFVVDVRDDEDHVGGSVRGATHCSDTSLRNASSLASLATRVLSIGSNATVVFHCMESLRRGPRCAKRMQLLFDDLELKQNAAPTIKILQGGADKWIRFFWKNTHLVEGYKDDYWGFQLDEDAQKGKVKGRQHRNYVRPNDGLSNSKDE